MQPETLVAQSVPNLRPQGEPVVQPATLVAQSVLNLRPQGEPVVEPATLVAQSVPNLRPQGEPVTQVLERNLVPAIDGKVVQDPQSIPFEVSDEFIGTRSVPTPEDTHALLKSEARVANQYGLATPTVLDNNRTPGEPLISGESRKVRKLPSAKPSVVDVNVPVATVVSQNDPDAIQVKNFKKAKWEAQKEDSFIRNGYVQEGWVTSVGTLPSEMATLAPTMKAITDAAPVQNIEFGEAPEAISQGEPELITYEETFSGSIEVAPEDYSIPVEPEDEAPTYLTPEIVQQQAAKLDSVCLTNTQDFVKSSGGTLNTFGGSGNNFQEIKADLASDEDKISYSMEIFAMLQQALADNPDLQQAIAEQHAGGSKNSHVKATWTLSMDIGASYTLSTDSSQAYQPRIEVVVNNQGAVVVNDGNGIELARIVSTAQNGDCDNASYDVVIANN
ncbi:hypothetical protein RB980_002207 [Vibrio fluvialis]|nr:hypothetical protein [Vibrio fluvialis]